MTRHETIFTVQIVDDRIASVDIGVSATTGGSVMAHDAQIIGGDITTSFDSLCVGATVKNPERREILGPTLDALEYAGPMACSEPSTSCICGARSSMTRPLS